MELHLQIISIIISVLFLLFLFNQLRKRVLELKYTLIWLAVSVTLVCFSIFPQFVFWLTELLHIEVPANTLFLFGIFFLMVITLMQNIIISKLREQVKDLIQEVGILKSESSNKREH